MIKLTIPDTLGHSEPVWLNSNHISAIRKLSPNTANPNAITRLWVHNISYEVEESVDTVLSMIKGDVDYSELFHRSGE